MSAATLVETRSQDVPRSFDHEAKSRVRRPAPTHTMQRSNSTSSPFNRSASDVDLTRSLSMRHGYAEHEPPIAPPQRVLSDMTLHHGTTEGSNGLVSGQRSRRSQGAQQAKQTPQKPSNQIAESPKITVSKYILHEPSNDILPEATIPEYATVDGAADVAGPMSRLRNKSSLHSLKKRTSWLMMRSRSPSPSSKKLPAEPSHTVGSFSGDQDPRTSNTNGVAPVLRRTGTAGASKARRPLSAFLGRSKTSPLEDSQAPSLPKSASTDRLPNYGRHLDAPDVPTVARRERSRQSGPDVPRKKDELWTVFRQLDSDYAKFQAKPGSLKPTIVRGALLPFLRSHADHPSNRTLRAEDLDRRAGILNRWWMGLLEMVNGRHGQVLSGSDRPAVLDALIGIMTRPEWRTSVTTIASRSVGGTPASHSSTSLDSWGSDFMTESVLHNVRNMFVQNLLSQMAFVVDRMSMRNILASTVAFCGKATAYAFAFCPGVADILVRLWTVPQNNVRRVLDEYSIPRNARLGDTAAESAKFFPYHLKTLGFSSLVTLMRTLRSPLHPSIVLDRIHWHAPWVGRWVGRDSDLFFCFVKAYHALACELLPEDASPTERLCAPGAVLVQAQLLSIMDITMHGTGTPGGNEATEPAPPPTFDDVLGADVPANPLPPIRAPSAVRLMAENRLIRLLRETLAETSLISGVARRGLASTFNSLLRATARRVSVYDQNACFALCDFLEESMVILVRYYRDSHDALSFWDWPFWFDVFQRMALSSNSMIDIRLHSLVYGLWGWLVQNPQRKKDICIRWLLDPTYFYQHFNHWCPMVRAYYMRLLCWRIGRYDGEASDMDK